MATLHAHALAFLMSLFREVDTPISHHKAFAQLLHDYPYDEPPASRPSPTSPTPTATTDLPPLFEVVALGPWPAYLFILFILTAIFLSGFWLRLQRPLSAVRKCMASMKKGVCEIGDRYQAGAMGTEYNGFSPIDALTYPFCSIFTASNAQSLFLQLRKDHPALFSGRPEDISLRLRSMVEKLGTIANDVPTLQRSHQLVSGLQDRFPDYFVGGHAEFMRRISNWIEGTQDVNQRLPSLLEDHKLANLLRSAFSETFGGPHTHIMRKMTGLFSRLNELERFSLGVQKIREILEGLRADFPDDVYGTDDDAFAAVEQGYRNWQKKADSETSLTTSQRCYQDASVQVDAPMPEPKEGSASRDERHAPVPHPVVYEDAAVQAEVPTAAHGVWMSEDERHGFHLVEMEKRRLEDEAGEIARPPPSIGERMPYIATPE